MRHQHQICLLPLLLAALLNAPIAPSTAAASSQRVICIDPGHPSEVGRGASGRHITELHAAWVVALKLRADLEKRGYKVVMTKQSEGEFVRNRARAETANAAGADLMVRLHCDSGSGSGIACYVPERQGLSEGTRGPSQSIIDRSMAMGRTFHAALIKSLHGALIDRGLLPDTATKVGGKQGALTGSVFSHVPVVLIEMCVLSNRHDDAFMASSAGQDKVAKALADAVDAALANVPE
jgi:N-acetylmuramoyl-L-alanine amidase